MSYLTPRPASHARFAYRSPTEHVAIYLHLIWRTALTMFADPRVEPTPGSTAVRPRTTDDPDALKDLLQLCRQGRLYEVERWIQRGQPLQLAPARDVRSRRSSTPLAIALEAGNHALVHLLLCNTYDPNLEPDSPLDMALRGRRTDLLDLLLEWGADPREADPDALFATYNTELLERFHSLGVDLTADHALAGALAEHTSNKPLFGFCKRHRGDPLVQKELDIALVHHAGHDSEKGVSLGLWAGADPHARVPVLEWWHLGDDDEDEDTMRSTAIAEACQSGAATILEKLGPDPTRDDFDDLYRWARDGAVVTVLARSALPTDVDSVLHYMLTRGSWGPDSGWQALSAAERMFEVGGRWEHSSRDRIANFRRGVLRMSDRRFVDWMRLLAKDDYCAPEILRELGRTPAIRRRMTKVGIIPGARDRWGQPVYRPTGSRTVLKAFGVELPKKKVVTRIPRTLDIGSRRRDAREIRMTREELFERVWSRPVSRLAADWGLSGPGLAKACRRLKVPLPGRGHWAKVNAGHARRRPKLPQLPEGQGEEVVVWAPMRDSSGDTTH